MTSDAEFREHVTVAKRYFYAGFLGLPLLWLAMAANFWSISREPAAPAELKGYVNKAAFSGSFCLAGLAVWITVFQLNWKEWENGRDLLVVNIPEPSGW